MRVRRALGRDVASLRRAKQREKLEYGKQATADKTRPPDEPWQRPQFVAAAELVYLNRKKKLYLFYIPTLVVNTLPTRANYLWYNVDI